MGPFIPLLVASPAPHTSPTRKRGREPSLACASGWYGRIALVWFCCAGAIIAAERADDGYRYPPQRHGEITATLEVRVAKQPVAPGQGEATLLIIIEGPATLEVGQLRLEDALEAWTEPAAFSSWSSEGERVTWAMSLDLVQAKPGPAPLPALRLRCREGPASEWHELRWVDILKEPRSAPPPEELSPLPPSPWPAVLRWGGIVVAGVLVLLGLVWGGRRWLRVPPEPVPVHVRALQELARLEGAVPEGDERSEVYAKLANVLRAYLGERFQLDTARRTSDELLAEVARLSVLGEEQLAALRGVFASCDLAKFAGANPPAEECREALRVARGFVEETAPDTKKS